MRNYVDALVDHKKKFFSSFQLILTFFLFCLCRFRKTFAVSRRLPCTSFIAPYSRTRIVNSRGRRLSTRWLPVSTTMCQNISRIRTLLNRLIDSIVLRALSSLIDWANWFNRCGVMVCICVSVCVCVCVCALLKRMLSKSHVTGVFEVNGKLSTFIQFWWWRLAELETLPKAQIPESKFKLNHFFLLSESVLIESVTNLLNWKTKRGKHFLLPQLSNSLIQKNLSCATILKALKMFSLESSAAIHLHPKCVRTKKKEEVSFKESHHINTQNTPICFVHSHAHKLILN